MKTTDKLMNQNGASLAAAIAKLPDTDKPWLGNTNDVADFVTGINGQVKDLWGEAIEKSFSPQQYADKLGAIADAGAKVLLGRDDTWEPHAGWNEPGIIDAWLRERFRIGETDPLAVCKAAIMLQIQDFLAIMTAHADNPELDLSWRVTGNVETFRDAYVGAAEADVE